MPAPGMAVVRMSGPATATSASPDSGGEAPTDVERLEIEKTDNGGFVVTCYTKPPAQGGEIGNALAFTRPSKHSFGSMDELTGYVQEAFGGGETAAPTEPPPEEQPAEGPPPEEDQQPA